MYLSTLHPHNVSATSNSLGAHAHHTIFIFIETFLRSGYMEHGWLVRAITLEMGLSLKIVMRGALQTEFNQFDRRM